MLRAVEQPHNVEGTKILLQRLPSLEKTGREEHEQKRKIAILHIQNSHSIQKSVLPTLHNDAMWKLRNFSSTQILREINFSVFRSSRNCQIDSFECSEIKF